MKSILRIALALLMACPFSQMRAQSKADSPDVNYASVMREIIEQEEAIANYDIPEDILSNLGMSPGQLKRPGTGAKKPVKKAVNNINGYRIQVFSDGRNPATLQSRARARGNMIVSKFPKYRGQIYSFSASPNWYTRVGNFQTSEEANKALAELKRAFPAFAAEMRVVKSQIKIVR